MSIYICIENTNDLAFVHSTICDLFSSICFKCKQHPDPPGPLYPPAKEYIHEYLKPGSFKSYWKCIVALKPFMRKGSTQMTVLSAPKLGGFLGTIE